MLRVRARAVVVALTATLATASCVSSNGSAADTAAPAAGSTTPAYTNHQVRGALPDKRVLRKRYDNVTRVDPTTVALFCGDVGAVKPANGAGATVSARSPREAAGWSVFTSVVITGLVFPRHEAAERFVTRTRTAAERCEGKIDHGPLEQADGGFRPGEHGRGTLSDATVRGWRGFRLVAVTRWSTPDAPKGPTMAHGNLVTLRGNAVFVVSALRPDDGPRTVARTLDAWMSHVTADVG